jgi:hypothetical protein
MRSFKDVQKCGRALVLGLVLLTAAAAVASPEFFGVDNTNLVRLDLAAGTKTVVGALGVDQLADIDFNGAGTLLAVRYGLGGGFPPSPLYEGWRIDTNTGAGTFLSSFGFVHLFSALAYRPTDGNLYTVDQNTGYLGTVDLNNATFTPLTATPHGLGQYKVDALAFAPNGVLYGLHNEVPPIFGYQYDLVQFDLTTGLGTVIGSVDGGVGDYQSFRFDPGTGMAYTINALNGSASTLNLATGAGSVIWSGLAPGVTGLAFIPEPAGLSLFALGGLLAARRRR